MSTDPEFLAMKCFARVLDGLPDEATKQRVIRWVVAKTFDRATVVAPPIPETASIPQDNEVPVQSVAASH